MTNAAVSLRKATTDDLELIVGFTRQEAEEAEGLELDEARLHRGVGEALRDSTLATYFVIEEEASKGESKLVRERRAVGFVSLVREWSDWNGGFYWWIQAIFLVPDTRGRGVLGCVVDQVAAYVRAQGGLDLRLYTHRTNARAIRAYRKLGFEGERYKLMTRPLLGIGT